MSTGPRLSSDHVFGLAGGLTCLVRPKTFALASTLFHLRLFHDRETSRVSLAEHIYFLLSGQNLKLRKVISPHHTLIMRFSHLRQQLLQLYLVLDTSLELCRSTCLARRAVAPAVSSVAGHYHLVALALNQASLKSTFHNRGFPYETSVTFPVVRS